MTNFLTETLIKIKNIGKEPTDVWYVARTTENEVCSFDLFEKAADFRYDDGCGIDIIAKDLIIVFTDRSWLERYEYDGDECWVHRTLPIKPRKKIVPNREWMLNKTKKD